MDIKKILFKTNIRETLIVINGFLHDMATGLWIGGLVLMTVTVTEAGPEPVEPVAGFAASLLSRVSDITFAALFVMLLTGVFRVFTYRHYGWTGDIAPGRRRLVIIKHVIFAFVMTAGLILHFRLLAGGI